MAIHEVTYYQAKCDRCGYIETDYGDYSAMADPIDAQELAAASDWTVNDDKLYCPECWEVVDDE